MSNWKDFKGLGPWDFTPQPNKWGYLNNPRWTEVPFRPAVNYDGRESEEPQIWDMSRPLVGGEKDIVHNPCGHWHKGVTPSTTLHEWLIAGLNTEDGQYLVFLTNPLMLSHQFSYVGAYGEYGDVARCYGCCVDLENDIGYFFNEWQDNSMWPDPDSYGNYLEKIDLKTGAHLGHLDFAFTPANTDNLKNISETVVNGFIYMTRYVGTPGANHRLYKIDASTLTLGAYLELDLQYTLDTRNNSIYPDPNSEFLYMLGFDTLNPTLILYKVNKDTMTLVSTTSFVSDRYGSYGVRGRSYHDTNTQSILMAYRTTTANLYKLIEFDLATLAVVDSADIDSLYPYSVAANENYVFVLIPYPCQVLIFSRGPLTYVGSFAIVDTGLSSVNKLSIDRTNNKLYILGYRNAANQNVVFELLISGASLSRGETVAIDMLSIDYAVGDSDSNIVFGSLTI